MGWQGIRLILPPEWNLTAFSMERGGGYLKIDSPGTMFAQVKWTDPGGRQKPRSLFDVVSRGIKRVRRVPAPPPPPPDLRAALDTFIKQTGKQAKKSKTAFDYKVKPETREAGGERTALHFSWSGGGHGQGKIWHCATCGRTVIAQIVGQGRDNVAGVAAAMFSSFGDHPEDGWTTWGLYDLESQIPTGFGLKSQKLMSGYLRLEFGRRGERILVERWGLANITRKRFTLKEWLRHTCGLASFRAKEEQVTVHGHGGLSAVGAVQVLGRLTAIRDAGISLRPATRYQLVGWECEEGNKIYAVQAWLNRRSEPLAEEVAARCACH